MNRPVVASRAGYTRSALAVGAILLGLLVYDGVLIYRAGRFNDLLVGQAYTQAAQHNSPNGLFAAAYDLQQQHQFEPSLKAYARVQTIAGSGLGESVKFNMANLYMQQAMEAYRKGEDDLAIPLVQLAKENYRGLLRVDQQNWDAKFNLEIALQLLPDLDREEALDEVMPERSQRALSNVEVRDQLP